MFLYLQLKSYYTYSDASKLTLEKVCFGTLKDQKTEMVIRFGLMIEVRKIRNSSTAKTSYFFNGVDKQEASFLGSTVTIDGLKQTFNLDSGINKSVTVAPSYFKFSSSNNEVAE
jgi:hypothetical protein